MKYLIKRILLNVLICTGLISAMSASVALTQDEEPVLTIFQRGIQQFNEKKFEEAKNNFFLAYQKEDSSPTFSYNLALSFGELNQGPQTLAYLRRAQELNPFSLEYRKAWEYYSKKFPVPEMPRRLGTWDFFIEQLRWIPSVLIFLPLLILMGFSGSLVTRRIRKKKSGNIHI